MNHKLLVVVVLLAVVGLAVVVMPVRAPAGQVSSFTGGQYLVWNLTGHVTIQFTRDSGANALVSGVFLAPAGQ